MRYVFLAMLLVVAACAPVHQDWLGCCHVVNGTGGASWQATGTCVDAVKYWDGNGTQDLDDAYRIAANQSMKCWLN